MPERGTELPTAPPVPVTAPDTAPLAVLAGVEVRGATVFSEAELAALYQPYLGREIGTEDVAAIVTAITAHYRQAGYVLSYAVARPQDLDYGILRVEVIEGYVERVVFEGPVNGDRARLDAFAAKLRQARPLTQRALERYVLLINDLPGLTAKPSLRRNGELSAGHDLILTLSADRFDGRASIDNRGTRPIGRNIAELSGNFNSALGMSERTGVYLFIVPDQPSELRSAELLQEYVVSSEGLLVGVDGWYSRTEPGAGLSGFDLNSEDERVAVYVTQPVERSRALSIFVSGMLEYRETTEETAGVNIYDDRIRSIRLAVRSFFIDPWDGANLLSVTGSQGLDVLHASDNAQANLSRRGGRIDYAKVEAAYTRWQDLAGPWSVELGVKGQRAVRDVLAAEEFRAGGSAFGRAYDPSEIAGDHGAAGYFELRRDVPTENTALAGMQLFAFYDLAAAWNDDPQTGTFKRSIASGGVGARLLLLGRVRAEMELAKPLTSPVQAEGIDGDDPRLFFSPSTNF